ncbi:helix-turn-helix transcriptional regulator [Paenibacillus tritici]|uniref:helix-turn-helix transcriptional regulator n=1 Tax=Paenibacillus tritici TaxID=1873425 RepID=UPI001FE8E200|nr:helix-turn-helix domain-containing protein [Paenibacillus tritici]
MLYRILCVERNRHVREIASYMAGSRLKNFIIHAHADYSSDILRLIRSEGISLVLLNIRGTHTPGMRLCEQIRQGTSVPIILLGGSGDFELARQALLYNVSDYLTDPVDPAELGRSLETVRRGFAPADRPAAAQRDYAEPAIQNEKEPPSPCPIVSTIKQYVEEQLHHNITLKRISDSLNFNCAYLGQKFKQQENMSFNEYLLRQRMEKAKLLLETTDMKIYEIADAVGYTEIDWFYKKFRAYTGASANEYRKQCFITA